MHAPATALLLLTSCLSAVPKAVAHSGHAHKHVHKRAADVVTEYDYVTQLAYVTVDQNGNTVPAPTATAIAAPYDAAPVPSPPQVPQDGAEPAVGAAGPESSAYTGPSPTPAAIPAGNSPAVMPAANVKASASVPSVEASVAPEPAISHSSAPAPSASTGQFPFSRIVAFGDSLTDNGNGTFAHCTQAGAGDCGNKIYGHGTWTNGPVAVSYLSDKLNIPLTEDYAWGWNHGGGVGDKMAATIKQSFDASPDSQDGFQQVANYLSSGDGSISETLQFLWIGNMDIALPKFQYPDNTQWSSEMASMISQLVGQLISAGAPYVLVPGLYAKQIAPFHDFMASEPLQQEQMGEAIQQANAMIKSTLENTYGDKVIYYNVFDRMMDIWNNHASYGIDMVGDNFCDGDTVHPTNFEVCLMQGQGDRWYWINWTDFTTHVHSLIADDMYSALQARFS